MMMNYGQNNTIINEAVTALSEPKSYRGLYRHNPEGQPLPSREVLSECLALVQAIVFPGYYGTSTLDDSTIAYHIGVNVDRLHRLLSKQILYSLCFERQEGEQCCSDNLSDKALALSADFVAYLPALRTLLSTDVEAAYMGDPAASSIGEVICCYPSLTALTYHRVAHKLHRLGVTLLPRMIAELAHSLTGIDIHPEAQIGSHFFVDHGTGVVIGATSIIGNRVKIYQGVTLGAKSFPREEDGTLIRGLMRHPIIEDDVVIYSNTTILGRVTIGSKARIGANLWITEDVPSGSILSR